MLLSSLALALTALPDQEAAQPASPQAQFDAWFASLPKEHPRPLKQNYSWSVDFSVDGAEGEEAAQIAAFMNTMQCEGEIRMAFAESWRFKIEVDAQVHFDDGEEDLIDFEGYFGLVADGERLKAYANIEEGTSQESEHGGVSFAIADAERVYERFRAALPAIMTMAEVPPIVSEYIADAWAGMPKLADLLHPRGYAFTSLSTTPVTGFRREADHVTLEFRPDRQVMEAMMNMESTGTGDEELTPKEFGALFDGLHMSMTADATTGQPTGGLLQMELPLSTFEETMSGTMRMRFEIKSEVFARAAPAAADLAAPEGIEWIDGKPFIELALMGLKQMLDEAASSEDEEF